MQILAALTSRCSVDLRQLGEEEAECEWVVEVPEGVGEGGVAFPHYVVETVHGFVLHHPAHLRVVLLGLGVLDL